MTDSGSGDQPDDRASQNLRTSITEPGDEVEAGATAAEADSASPEQEVEPAPELQRIKVLRTDEDEAATTPAAGDDLPLPAMAPGTGGSRIGSGDVETTEGLGDDTAEVTAEEAAGEDTAEVTAEEAAGEDTAEVTAEEAAGEDTAEVTAEDAGAGAEGGAPDGGENAAPKANVPLPPPPMFLAPGVPGVRLQRTPTQAPQVPEEPGPDEGADSEVIRVTADRIPQPRVPETDQVEGIEAEAGRHLPGPQDDLVDRGERAAAAPSVAVKIATGLGFGVVALVVIVLGKTAFAALIALLVTWVAAEFFGALYQSITGDEQAIAGGEQEPGADGEATQLLEAETVAGEVRARPVLALARRPAAYVAVAATAGTVVTAYLFGIEAVGAFAVGATMACLLWFAGGVERGAAPKEASLSVLGYVHIAVLGSFAMLILRLEHGFALLLAVVVLTVVSDVAAYGWGTSFGHTPFFASVSPNKSLEGFVGAAGTTIAVGGIIVLLQGWLYDSVPTLGNLALVLVLALVVTVAATAGDLAESMFKRDLGMKDVATLLPGHGGFFDRLDGMVFALPVAYTVMRLAGIADVG